MNTPYNPCTFCEVSTQRKDAPASGTGIHPLYFSIGALFVLLLVVLIGALVSRHVLRKAARERAQKRETDYFKSTLQDCFAKPAGTPRRDKKPGDYSY